jgi:hypothetical protein
MKTTTLTTFNQIQFEERLVATLVRLWKMGRKGRLASQLREGAAKKQLRNLGYSSLTAQKIVRNCSDMAALELYCDDACSKDYPSPF